MSFSRLPPLIALVAGVAIFSPSHGQTLKDAIMSGNADEVATLLDEGADLEKLGVMSPLYLAAQRGRAEIVELLLARGADVDGTTRFGSPLHIAARSNRPEIADLLLSNGADPNIAGEEYGTAPLHAAAETGALEAARVLLSHGADVNRRSGTGHPPIHRAALKGHDAMVALLREHGAAPIPVEPLRPGELAGADVSAGKIRINECERCHVAGAGETAAPGPNLWNIVGRPIANVEGYAYSEAFRTFGRQVPEGAWTFEALNRFLADPTGQVPGTNMYLGGETDRAKRVALIAYLSTLNDDPVPLD